MAVTLQGRKVTASVENPVPDGPGQAGGNQMALANIEQRLQAIYGGDGQLHIERPAQRFRAELSYPAGTPA